MYNARENHDRLHYLNTGLPVVASETVLFQRRENVGGEIERRSFDRDVLWLARLNTKVRLMHRGVLISDLSEMEDSDSPNGFMKGFENIERLTELAKQYKIDGITDLELAEVAYIVLIPVMVTTASKQRENDANSGFQGGLKAREWYSRIPNEWQALDGTEFADFNGSSPRVLITETLWSTHPKTEVAEDFFKRWTPETIRSYLEENGIPGASTCKWLE